MSKKEARTSNDILFYYPISNEQRLRALHYIEKYGVDDFIQVSNLPFYVPNVFPLRSRQLKQLSSLAPEQILDQIDQWIEHSHLLWNNVSADATQNQHVNTAKLGYIGSRYGTAFIMGDMDALPDNAFSFPLLEEEMFMALDVIHEKGIKFFVKHCAELPECNYLRDTEEETIANLESLYRWYGAYWLIGQLNAAAILSIKQECLKSQ